MKNFILLTCFVLVGFSSKAQITDSYIEYLEELLTSVESDINPIGLSIAIKQGDDEWSSSIGISSIDDSLNTDHLLAMGSITKTFVSACILSMTEEGLLNLDDPIGKFLPAYDNVDSLVTIEQLLNHTSGIHNYTTHPIFFDDVFSGLTVDRFYTPEDILNRFVLAPIFDKGTSQDYSNTNYVLLGMIITELAGRPYYEEIFDRFDIINKYPSISIAPQLQPTTDLADLWADLGSGLENIPESGLSLSGMFSSAGSAGAFISKPKDLVKWGYDLYSGSLLSQESMDAMLDYFGGGQIGYGLGVVGNNLDCGDKVVGHSGGIIYSSNLAYSPELDLSVVAMTNDGEAGNLVGITDEIICNYKLLVSSEETLLEHISIDAYPNPVIDQLELSLNGLEGVNWQLELYSSQGQKILSKENISGEKKTVLDLSSCDQTGILYLRVYNERESITKKIIKI